MKNKLGIYIPIIFFTCYFMLGLSIYKDYGISVDEPQQRLIGATSINYIANKFQITSILNNKEISSFDTPLSQMKDKDYGVFFEAPSVLMEHIFNLKNEKDIYQARHLLTFLFFLVGVASIFQIAKRRFNDWRVGLISCIFLILSPRFFAESFYNDKDIVFMAVFAISINTAISFILNPSWKKALIHGLASAIAIDTRLMAIVIPMMTLSILSIKFLKSEIRLSKLLLSLGIYISVLIVFVIILWPFLWEAPLRNFLQALSQMSNFARWTPNILFRGEMVNAAALPWYYIPIWICTTTPITYLILFCLGSLTIFRALLQNKFRIWKTESQLQDILFLGLFFAPITAVIVLKSTLYNGWRHLYFIYPAFILITTVGTVFILKYISNNFGRVMFGLILLTTWINTATWMINSHPLQNLYFNYFSGDWNRRFEVDYWGLGNRIALEKILKDSPKQSISIWPGLPYQWPGGWQMPFTQNLMILDAQERLRIKSPDSREDADYIINSKQNVEANRPESYDLDHRYKLFDEIKIDGQPVLSIYKKVDNPILPQPKLNELIKFSHFQVGRNYLLSGWQWSESWGTWSDSFLAKLILPLPSGNAQKLVITYRVLVGPNLPNQIIEIYVNDNYVKKVKVSSFQNNILEIPISKWGSVAVITFKLPNASTPKLAGINSDDVRLLAIGIETAEFR